MPQPRNVIWTVVDREAMLVDVETGDYFSLNPVATDMWRRLQAGEDAAGIAAAVAAQYGIDGDTVAADLTNLLAQLRDANLVS